MPPPHTLFTRVLNLQNEALLFVWQKTLAAETCCITYDLNSLNVMFLEVIFLFQRLHIDITSSIQDLYVCSVAET